MCDAQTFRLIVDRFERKRRPALSTSQSKIPWPAPPRFLSQPDYYYYVTHERNVFVCLRIPVLEFDVSLLELRFSTDIRCEDGDRQTIAARLVGAVSEVYPPEEALRVRITGWVNDWIEARSGGTVLSYLQNFRTYSSDLIAHIVSSAREQMGLRLTRSKLEPDMEACLSNVNLDGLTVPSAQTADGLLERPLLFALLQLAPLPASHPKHINAILRFRERAQLEAVVKGSTQAFLLSKSSDAVYSDLRGPMSAELRAHLDADLEEHGRRVGEYDVKLSGDPIVLHCPVIGTGQHALSALLADKSAVTITYDVHLRKRVNAAAADETTLRNAIDAAVKKRANRSRTSAELRAWDPASDLSKVVASFGYNVDAVEFDCRTPQEAAAQEIATGAIRHNIDRAKAELQSFTEAETVKRDAHARVLTGIKHRVDGIMREWEGLSINISPEIRNQLQNEIEDLLKSLQNSSDPLKPQPFGSVVDNMWKSLLQQTAAAAQTTLPSGAKPQELSDGDNE